MNLFCEQAYGSPTLLPDGYHGLFQILDPIGYSCKKERGPQPHMKIKPRTH